MALHDAQSRRVRRQRARSAALRRARADSHRGTARRRPVLRRRRAVLHDRRSTTGSRSVSKKRSTSGAASTCCATSSASSASSGRSILVSRFQGNERDGHGNHQTAGVMTIAGVPGRRRPERSFPSRSPKGSAPWQPLKVYIGGVRENEDWTVRVDPGEFSPVARHVLSDFARVGLSFQRSQNSGRLSLSPGPQLAYYKRVDTVVDGPAKRAQGESSSTASTRRSRASSRRSSARSRPARPRGCRRSRRRSTRRSRVSRWPIRRRRCRRSRAVSRRRAARSTRSPANRCGVHPPAQGASSSRTRSTRRWVSR